MMELVALQGRQPNFGRALTAAANIRSNRLRDKLLTAREARSVEDREIDLNRTAETKRLRDNFLSSQTQGPSPVAMQGQPPADYGVDEESVQSAAPSPAPMQAQVPQGFNFSSPAAREYAVRRPEEFAKLTNAVTGMREEERKDTAQRTESMGKGAAWALEAKGNPAEFNRRYAEARKFAIENYGIPPSKIPIEPSVPFMQHQMGQAAAVKDVIGQHYTKPMTELDQATAAKVRAETEKLTFTQKANKAFLDAVSNPSPENTLGGGSGDDMLQDGVIVGEGGSDTLGGGSGEATPSVREIFKSLPMNVQQGILISDNPRAAFSKKLLEKKSGFTLQTNADGSVSLVMGDGGGAGDNAKKTVNDLQKSITSTVESIVKLDTVAKNYEDGFLTYKGQLSALSSRIREKAGATLSKEDRRFLGKRRKFTQAVDQVFNTYRKEITGAAAAMSELRALKKAMLNTDLSPTEFKAAFAQYKGELQRTLRIKNMMLRDGVKYTGTKLDELFMSGADDDPESRGNELEAGGMKDEQIMYKLIDEGYIKERRAK